MRSPRPEGLPGHRRGLRARVALALPLLLSGCATDLPHVARAVAGHLSVMTATRPVPDWLADPATPAPLRERLQLAEQLRAFSVTELGLPDNASYRRYADLGRPAVLWNVVVAPELSLELKTWCYPVAGCVGYRGHFDPERARREAAHWREQGWEVAVVPVPAYSTLGWTALIGGDPLLNTFTTGSPIELARLLFHELAHQVAYAADDMAFSESYATAVEQLGLAAWRHHPSARSVPPEQWQAWQTRQHRRRQLMALVHEHRQNLQAVYRSKVADERRRERKAELQRDFMQRYRHLRDSSWQADATFDAWVESLNNASLALQASYTEGVPAFEALFEREGRNFPRFHEAVRELARAEPAKRAQALQALRGLGAAAGASEPSASVRPQPF